MAAQKPEETLPGMQYVQLCDLIIKGPMMINHKFMETDRNQMHVEWCSQLIISTPFYLYNA